MAKPQDILKRIEKTSNPRLRAEQYHLLATIYLEERKPEKVIESLKMSGELAKQFSEDERNEIAQVHAGILISMGILFTQEKDFKTAVKAYTKATRILERLFEEEVQKDFSFLLHSYLSIIELSENLKDFHNVKKNYRAILKLTAKLPEKDRNSKKYKSLAALAHQRIGSIALENIQTEEARKELTQSLFLYQELVSEKGDEYRPQLIFTLNNLGISCRLDNQYSNAIRYLMAALEQQEILSKKDPQKYLPYCA
ncbi:MAG TPA: tetratricopeptide repeat protein, partial [Phaeodactylibacter sp.]|nr:tetratricopeptide repeat protein [Phaeodactylibacter sp.]